MLIVSTNADLAGAPSHVRDLVLGLSEHFQMCVVFGEDGPIRSSLAARGIATRVIPGMRSAISPVQDIVAVRALRALIRELRPALIHAHSSKAGMVARIAGRLERVPVIFTVHGWGFGPGRPRLQATLVAATERLLRNWTHRYVAVSSTDARLGQRWLGLPAEAIPVIPNGVPDVPERADPSLGSGFVMVARTDYPKDYQLALRAFGRLPDTGQVFTAVGAGTDAAAFVQQARDWAGPAAGRLNLLGSRTDIASQLARHAVFVLCSRFEGLPLSIIEAMRAGLPVIATRVGGIPELIEDRRNGLLVDDGDVEGLAQAMAHLAANPGVRAHLGAAARARYQESFAIGRMTDSVASLYRSVLESEPGVRT